MNPASAPAAASGAPFPRTPQIIFANWREGLHQSGLSAGIQTVYRMAVEGYLDYCAHNGISVTTDSARAYMEEVTRRAVARQPELWKEGLNWFFRAGRQHCGTGASVGGGSQGLPSPGQADTGAAAWEQRLIERLRIEHYAWRTEQTYREWAWRLADFVRPRELDQHEESAGQTLQQQPAYDIGLCHRLRCGAANRTVMGRLHARQGPSEHKLSRADENTGRLVPSGERRLQEAGLVRYGSKPNDAGRGGGRQLHRGLPANQVGAVRRHL